MSTTRILGSTALGAGGAAHLVEEVVNVALKAETFLASLSLEALVEEVEDDLARVDIACGGDEAEALLYVDHRRSPVGGRGVSVLQFVCAFVCRVEKIERSGGGEESGSFV